MNTIVFFDVPDDWTLSERFKASQDAAIKDEEEYEIEYEDKDSIDIQKYIFSEEHILELIEIFFYLIDDYIKYNPHIINNVGFYNILLEDIQDLYYLQIEDYIIFIQKQYHNICLLYTSPSPRDS